MRESSDYKRKGACEGTESEDESQCKDMESGIVVMLAIAARTALRLLIILAAD